ncbi:MAG: DUF721 domain-containing protein [Pyrinomonadaceae bacterium]
MDKFIKVLPAILQASSTSEEVAEAACLAAWKHAVGEGLSSHAVPLHLENETLVIAVEDDIWKRQLEHMRAQLLFRLNSVLCQPLVKSLELRIDPATLVKVRRSPERNDGPREYRNDEIPAEISFAATAIEDPELRRAFLGAATSCIRRLDKSEV